MKTGYVALISVLIIGAVLVLIGTSVTLLAVSESQMALAEEKKEYAIHFVESCAEDTLRRLNDFNTLPTSVITPYGTCTVTTDAHSGNNWTFTVSGSQDSYTKNIQIQAARAGSTTITSWNEVQ